MDSNTHSTPPAGRHPDGQPDDLAALAAAADRLAAQDLNRLPDAVVAERVLRLRRPGGWTHPGCGGSWATCSSSPTPTAPIGTEHGAMPAAACGWPQPLTAWSGWM